MILPAFKSVNDRSLKLNRGPIVPSIGVIASEATAPATVQFD
jgi:hypothetical protein